MSDNVESLLREREGYVNRGLANRVAQVDAQLERLGFKVEAEPEVEAAAKRPARKRS
jgi:hypothetical protein